MPPVVASQQCCDMLATVAPPIPSAPASDPASGETSGVGQRLQRVRGEALVRFGPHGLADLRQVAPARVLFPEVEPGEFPLAVLVTTTGGLTGDDSLRLQVRIDPGASATLMPQAAEMLYHAARLLDLARTLVPAPEGGATCLDDILILRMAGADPRAVRETALRASQTLRSIAFGLSPNLPSLCYC